jgi:TrmH family RNA methyltransferase
VSSAAGRSRRNVHARPLRRRPPERRAGLDGPAAPPAGAPAVVRVWTEDNLFQHLEVLKRNRTKRHRFGEFFVEGVKALDQARANGWQIRTLAHAAGRRLSSWANEMLAASGAALHVELAPTLMDKLSDKEEASELVAVVAIPADRLDRITLGEQALVAVFDRPTSPGNLGSIVRSCDALGAAGLIITGHGADLYDPQTVRASVGSLFALPTIRLPSHQEVARWIAEQAVRGRRLQVVGGSDAAALAADQVDLTLPTVLVVGNETRGLSSGYRELCDVLVRIPMYGTADSLNVACAASILLYEAGRQRRQQSRAQPEQPECLY